MIATTFLTVTFWEFLKYYVILIAVFLPFSIIAVIHLNKKTDIIKKIDRYLDSKLYGEARTDEATVPGNAGTSREPGQETGTSGNEEDEEEGDTDPLEGIRERDENIGVAWFQMKVHDSYRCRINRDTAEMFKNTVGRWSCENSFVGNIENDKYFHAEKAGRTYILFGNDNENSACIYNIEVLPTDERWEFQQALNDVFSGRNINDVKSRMAGTPLIKADFNNNLTIYHGENHVEKITYEHGTKGTVLRVLHTIKDQDEDFIKSLVENLDERMKEIRGINSQAIRIWFHEDENEYVDFIAYLRKTHDGKILFAIGRNWRINGERTEIELNLPMVEKTFIRCLDGATLEEDNRTLEVINREDDNKEEKSPEHEEPRQPKNKRHATSRKKKKTAGPESEEDTGDCQEMETEGDGFKDGGNRKEPAESEEISSEPEDEDYSPDDDQNYE